MPIYAYVQADPCCPYCEAPLTDLISFQWGYLPDYQPCDEHVYRIGDAICWRVCEGAIPTWTFFPPPRPNLREPCNAGDPRVTEVFALDYQQDWLTGSCPRCSVKMGGAVVEIRGGMLVSARVYRDGELVLPPGTPFVAILPTGDLAPIVGPPRRTRSDCGEPTFWRAGDGPPVVS